MKLGVEQHDRVHDAQCRNRPAGSRADSPPIALAVHLGDQLKEVSATCSRINSWILTLLSPNSTRGSLRWEGTQTPK